MHSPAVSRRFAAAIGGIVLAIALVACSSTPAPAASGSPALGGSPSALPSVPESPSPSVAGGSAGPSASPATPSATPTSTPASDVWSKPETVPGFDGCGSAVAAIDEAGTLHLAATCAKGNLSEVRYAASSDGHWTTTTFPVPSNRLERSPQLAFSGSTLYLALTRLAPVDGGCGDDGLQDVGVYLRSRALPSGAWSEPRQIGTPRDELESLRVSGGTLHATVANDKDGRTYYESGPADGAIAQRLALTSVTGATSLRVGNDGVARIAFEGASGIEFGQVDGHRADTSVVPGTRGGWAPSLVLTSASSADLLWSLSYHGGGCVSPDPSPQDGTYFSTNAGGSWQTLRITKMVGESSLTVDPVTGAVHAVVSDFKAVVAFDRSADGAWTHQTLVPSFASSPVIRQAPSGQLVVVFSYGPSDPPQIQVMTKG